MLVVVAVLSFDASCTGLFEDGPSGPRSTVDASMECPPAPGTNSRTDQVRLGLAPTCAGCHLVGNSGYFASLHAFESLLVRNSRLVSPGNPDASELVMLLEGRRTGNSMNQMPLGGDPFATLSERGETEISLGEIREWISELEAPSTSSEPDRSVATVQRIGATHIELGLRDLLGLTEDDFYQTAYTYRIPELNPRNDDFYDVRSPDRAPGLYRSRNRFTALGGGSASVTQHEERTISTTFAQSLAPVSMAWCGMAIGKPGNTALFTVAATTTGTANDPILREQLADWHLLFLAETATESDIDDLIDSVFAPLEAASGTRTAWVGTCSYFVRHPLFVLY
jgi:hypothetical protein